VNAAMPSAAQQQYPATRSLHIPSLNQSSRRVQGLLLHPLTAICVVQAILSLILALSNTVFGDEADYLQVGQQEWAQWLHGVSWPTGSAEQLLSGSPVIYPPLGALAGGIGGLAGARILSLVFMLGATVLLYLTASRLLGRAEAAVAAALWAFSEPVLRLAFATFDPLSVALTALSAWFALQAGYRRRGNAYVDAAFITLALANATAYSGLVIDPIVVAFAFLVWLPHMGARRASLRAACFVAGLAVFFVLLMTASRSWDGLTFTVLTRAYADHQSIHLIFNDIWAYSGLTISLAVIGVAIAVSSEGRQRAALLVLLGCGALVVPAAQLHDQTGWSLDKHLAYGIWFAAMPAGYACVKLARRLPEISRQVAGACCVIALIYPVVNGWESAWNVYHSWPNANSFITAFKPIAALSSGLIYTSGQNLIAEYYTPQGRDSSRWSTELSLNPAGIKQEDLESYYAKQLRNGRSGVIVLFYATSFSSAPNLPGTILTSPPRSGTYQYILRLEGDNPGEPGLPELTLAIESDSAYGDPTTGPYDSASENGFYAIWLKKSQR